MERQKVSQVKKNRLSELPQNQRFWPDEIGVSPQDIALALYSRV